MSPRITRRPGASDRTMVGTLQPHCLSHQKPKASLRRNMTLREKKTPRASQHSMGWRARRKSLLLPVAGEVFLLTLPFIERGYRVLRPARLSELPVISKARGERKPLGNSAVVGRAFTCHTASTKTHRAPATSSAHSKSSTPRQTRRLPRRHPAIGSTAPPPPPFLP
jgi:hypothetical protein